MYKYLAIALLLGGLVACNAPQGAKELPAAAANPATADLQPPFPMDETKMKTYPSGLKIQIIQEGIGEPPKSGQTVVAKYHGMLNDSTVFDSSYNREKAGQEGTFKFALDKGQVIPAWDEGFSHLKIGSKAILVCPPDIAYGERGSGSIPPNSTLYFHVELVNITN